MFNVSIVIMTHGAIEWLLEDNLYGTSFVHAEHIDLKVDHNCSTGVSTEFTDIKSEAYCSIKSLIC